MPSSLGSIRSWSTGLSSLAAICFLSSCGGGGGGGSSGPPPSTFSLSTNSLSFSASSPISPAPPAQTVGGSVTGSLSGTLYIVVKATGTAVATVTNFAVSGNSGQAQVEVLSPTAVGSGTFSSSIEVQACLNDATCATGQLAGSPQTINVTYTVATPTLADSVMPHAIPAGASGQVVIRGHGFSGATAVSFGGTAATALTVVSDSEIRATYPSLAAGTYALQVNSGSVAFSGSVVAVPTPGYAAVLLPYPQATTSVRRIIYDAPRQALYVAGGNTNTGQSEIWWYTYSAATWSTPTAIVVPQLQDISLSADGSQLFVLTSSTILQYDPANLSAGPSNTINAPTSLLSQKIPITDTSWLSDTLHPVSMDGLAITNDGTAIITARYTDDTSGGPAYSWYYSFAAGTFAPIEPFVNFNLFALGTGGDSAQITATADGSRALLSSVPNLLNQAFPILTFDASVSRMSVSTMTFIEEDSRWVAADGAGDRLIPQVGSQFTAYNVYDASYNLLGTIPYPDNGAYPALQVLLNPQGTRAYLMINQQVVPYMVIRAYDLTASVAGGAFPQVGADIAMTYPVQENPGSLRGTVSPDGTTLFVAGDQGLEVVPNLP